MGNRIGIDVGGTFTDFVYYDDETGAVSVTKVPTTPLEPEKGCLRAIDAALRPEEVNGTRWFLHGTTVGLNALLERRGATVGLLVTEGFRDILEIRRGDRAEMYNLFWTPPPALVPRRRRQTVRERIRADGAVHRPMELSDIRAAATFFREEGVSAIAVAFLNAYANPDHELAAERELRAAGFAGQITLSHRVSGEYREYERTTTTVIDAYVKERMSNYLLRLQRELGRRGFDGIPLIVRSGGGAMSFEEARERSFETIISGPVAGAEGAGALSRACGLGDLVTADVGGTSFDTCLILNGRPQLMYEGEIIGLPVQTPWVDVRSIGAGGGSIAYVDAGGLLRVGPRSAGADPGPACYARGGVEPTLTDAAYVLGMLGSGTFESGLTLNADLATAALGTVAGTLHIDVDETARGIMSIAAAAMANAMREITIEQGIDPRGLKLLAFGGAGPLMGCLLADELDMPEICVPPYAGNFSAWGLLAADVTQTKARTRIMRLDESAISDVNDLLRDMFADLAAEHQSQAREAVLDVRLQGQDHSLNIDVPLEDGRLTVDSAGLARLFADSYETMYGWRPDEPAEIVSVRATVRTSLPRRQLPPVSGRSAGRSPPPKMSAYSFRAKTVRDFSVVRREDLPAGASLRGPAIITEATTTTYVDVGWQIEMNPSGCMMLKNEGGRQ